MAKKTMTIGKVKAGNGIVTETNKAFGEITENAATSEESASASQELNDQAINLKALVDELTAMTTTVREKTTAELTTIE